ncbi:ribosome maturation factor RimM [Francisella adeliensis]|uniref:Ribosome maturation factor RimM n=1 Tax=Francisella adeliensis TaxID=2007306 RepID=A0A2Z4XZI6_9GAMM|nr:ribosome maturation factor RimM [Francisella adeliensis]AXA34281.1 16S rRNA processing protein RimM [Francisella adeliensis]MBK2084924.1 16S rRNA processing protein RimM [Francisella adeliensis]MBK2096245.1 16S rRNA processing protein RimM [Francisella adeliensis]QIW12526.1 16S rRNA processing protein RimM [Francisella adeliensis]QIW14399.1 16S rRNA processing protein RimM [Francisella adeliensis]
MTEDFVEIARIGATYKLDGELNLYPIANSIETLLSYGDWYIQLANSQDWQKLSDENVFRRADKIYIKFANIDNANIAKKFVNAMVGVPKSALPELGNDETYYADLIDCCVTNTSNDSFGKVVDVIDTGSNQVLICQLDKDEYLIPYIKRYILSENIADKKITVDWEKDY